MDARIFRGRSVLPKGLHERRLETQRDHRMTTIRGEEEPRMADVLARSFVRASGDTTIKDFDVRQSDSFVHNTRGLRPEYASLADIYEGALRKVLSLQLNLKIAEQPFFLDPNDFAHRDKLSPPRPRAIRVEDAKHREELRQRRHTNEDENDPRIAPQGHNILRKVGERSVAESSAFHVPSKRRCDALGFPVFERDPETPPDHFGAQRHTGPEFHLEYGQSHYHPNVYGARMDPLRRTRLGPSYMGPRGVVHESYSRYSNHHREVPPFFSNHDSTAVRDGPTLPRGTEHEGREPRGPDGAVLNGMRANSVLKFSHPKMNITKLERDEREILEEKFNKANDYLTLKNSESSRLSEQKSPKLPHPERYQPYNRRSHPSSGPTNGSNINGAKKNGELEKHPKLETKRSSGVEGEKEDFLSTLGLARIL